MEEPDPSIQLKPRNFHLLFISILIILTLILLSLFPSQPPEFINQTLISNLWGLVYLLFIGIIVSYCLFSRRITGNDPKLDANERYLAGYLQFSSVFDNGFENFNGYDEKLIVDSWKWSPIFDKWENPKFEIQSTVVSGEKCDHENSLNFPVRSLRSEFVGNSNAECDIKVGTNLVSERFCKKNISQTQNYDCRYVNGESTAVFYRENCDLDNQGNPKLIDDYKPLNLPVRNLRSKFAENSNTESVDEIGTNLGDRFSENNDKIRKGTIRGLVPINLGKKFEEVVASPTPITWSSRSNMIEVREKIKPPHTRLLSMGAYEIDKLKSKESKLGRNQMEKVVGFSSLGDFEFEKLNSQSIQNSMKISGNSQANQIIGKGESYTHSRTLLAKEFDYMKAETKANAMKVKDEKRNAKSPPCVRPSSIGEFGNVKRELESKTDHVELRIKETLSQSESFWSSIYSPINSVSPSPNQSSPLSAISTDEQIQKVEYLMKKKVSFSSISTNNCQFSIGSSFEVNLEKKSDLTLKTSNKSRIEGNREKMKPVALDKPFPRGKSVRTIRTNKSFLIGKVEKAKELNLENISLEKSSNFCDQKEEKQIFCGSNKAQTKKETLNPSEKADFAIADNEELDTDDVDEKADAFIAKVEKMKELNLENSSLELCSNFCDYQNEKQNLCGSDKAQTKTDSCNPSEKTDFSIAGNEVLDTDEVDKKADAFIAKFREQIRLQKFDSIKRKR